MLNANPYQSTQKPIPARLTSEVAPISEKQGAIVPIKKNLAVQQKNERGATNLSAGRAIWNSLAIASMITLIGFGILSLKLSNDLRLMQAENQITQNQLTRLNGLQNEMQLASQTKISDYEVQISSARSQYAEMKAEQLVLLQENSRVVRLNTSLVEENNRLAELRAIEKKRLAVVSAAERVLFMSGTEATASSQGTLYLLGNTGMLVTHGLEPLRPEESYQLWLETAENARFSAGLIPISENQGPNWTEITLSPNAPNFVSTSISIEAVGGSISPTGPTILQGER